MQYVIDQVDANKSDTYVFLLYIVTNTLAEPRCRYALAKKFGQELIDNCREVVSQPPRYKDGKHTFRLYPLLY